MLRSLKLSVYLLAVFSTGFLVFFSTAGNVAKQKAEKTVKIGAWNIEWLGMPDNRGAVQGKKPGPQKAENIADYIMASGVDILGLEEVSDNDQNDKTRTNKTISEALDIIKTKTGKNWKHQLFHSKSGGEDNDQLTGIAWNTDVAKQVGEPMRIDVPHQTEGASIWARHPHAVKFSLGQNKTDIVMIVLHLKANTGGSPAPKIKRALEAKTLMKQLGNIENKFSDFDIVICGDTNILNKTEKAATIFNTFGFRDLNSEDETTHVGGAPFDRFFVPSNQPEFTGFPQIVFDEEYLQSRKPALTNNDFRRLLSDHFMITTKVRVMDDDD